MLKVPRKHTLLQQKKLNQPGKLHQNKKYENKSYENSILLRNKCDKQSEKCDDIIKEPYIPLQRVKRLNEYHKQALRSIHNHQLKDKFVDNAPFALANIKEAVINKQLSDQLQSPLQTDNHTQLNQSQFRSVSSVNDLSEIITSETLFSAKKQIFSTRASNEKLILTTDNLLEKQYQNVLSPADQSQQIQVVQIWFDGDKKQSKTKTIKHYEQKSHPQKNRQRQQYGQKILLPTVLPKRDQSVPPFRLRRSSVGAIQKNFKSITQCQYNPITTFSKKEISTKSHMNKLVQDSAIDGLFNLIIQSGTSSFKNQDLQYFHLEEYRMFSSELKLILGPVKTKLSTCSKGMTKDQFRILFKSILNDFTSEQQKIILLQINNERQISLRNLQIQDKKKIQQKKYKFKQTDIQRQFKGQTGSFQEQPKNEQSQKQNQSEERLKKIHSKIDGYIMKLQIKDEQTQLPQNNQKRKNRHSQNYQKRKTSNLMHELSQIQQIEEDTLISICNEGSSSLMQIFEEQQGLESYEYSNQNNQSCHQKQLPASQHLTNNQQKDKKKQDKAAFPISILAKTLKLNLSFRELQKYR